MGVTGLWSILHPCARPIKIETLNRKRLAVDASIWIYQFLKAVRDKEGNALRNSHVVGFFRRICKLLFFGIKPVFVFDGGAPVLKRQTITGRKRRREGRREDAVRTAGRLLAVQMQRRAEEDEQRRKDERDDMARRKAEEEEVPDEGLVYVDELQMTPQERQQNRKFRKKDAYHLPDLDVSLNEMGGPNDPRVMSLEDLEQYARQFDTGEDINVYDFSKIDYDSPFFMSLPASDRYNILNAARLRSRLRMGHSKEQLDSMFPDRMAFSKFQIDRVRERNELTTRLMNINDGDIMYKNSVGGGNRVAGEKAREYVLVKNDGVEGGWALGVISDEGTRQEKAINVDQPEIVVKDESSGEDEEGFEDVPIEGLNRLPKRRKMDADGDGDLVGRQKRAPYQARQSGVRRKAKRPRVARADDPESLFVADEPADAEEEEWEKVDANGDLFGEAEEQQPEDEDGDLRRAIAMSMEQGDGEPQSAEESEQKRMVEQFQQRAAEEARPIPKGNWRAIASVMNKRAHGVAPKSHEVTSFGVPIPKPDDDEDMEEDEAMDLQAALAESRKGKRKISPPPQVRRQAAAPVYKPTTGPAAGGKAKASSSSGPLPGFEKLDLGSSLLGKKKMQQRSEESAGGFMNAEMTEKELEKHKAAGPLPPWFNGDLDEGIKRQEELERRERQQARDFDKQFQFQSRNDVTLRRQETGEVIDLDGEDERSKGFEKGEVIDLGDDDDEPVVFGEGGVGVAPELTGKPVDDEIRMGDMADAVRVEPPPTEVAEEIRPSAPKAGRAGPFQDEESDEEEEEMQVQAIAEAERVPAAQRVKSPATTPAPEASESGKDDEGEVIDWSESEDERPSNVVNAARRRPEDAQPAGGERVLPEQGAKPPLMTFEDPQEPDIDQTAERSRIERSRSPSEEFEDVDMAQQPAMRQRSPPTDPAIVDDDDAMDTGPTPASGLVHQESLPEGDDEFDDFDDPEEEELLKALTLEAEEHARFASELNNKSTAENIAEYEKELKQLRNQQKKDRRDADEVTHIMVTECQQLLRLFGLPYVTAPMEAEAQCAELVSLGLVDGIVTDDSDCFLFGGTRVYKNMFNQAKFVECYLSSDLEKEFDLTRDKLINVAYLLGSDYTEGLPGVGPVTALEILSEFGDLTEFKDWFMGVQMGTITKEEDKDKPFRKKFRKNATKITLPPSFPDPRVELAYEHPEVDSDPQAFQWGVPDLDALRSFLMSTIGWSQERTDEVLVPVIRDMNRRQDEGTQANITAFFEGGVGIGAAGTNNRGEAFAPRKRVDGSKRMGKALGKMAERAKIQRTISQGGGIEGDGEERVDMRGVENGGGGAAVGAGEGSKARKAKGKKRAAADPVDKAEGEDGEGSELEEPRSKSRKKRAPAKGGKGRRNAAAVAVDE